MAVGKVSDADFEAEVLKATGPVVVDFWAEWCGPCRMIAPALDEISGAMGDKVKIVKLNVDESPKTASKYGVMSIPTLMIFKGGEMASRQVGAAPKAVNIEVHKGDTGTRIFMPSKSAGVVIGPRDEVVWRKPLSQIFSCTIRPPFSISARA